MRWIFAGLLLAILVALMMSRPPAPESFTVGVPRPPGAVTPQLAFSSDSAILLAPDGSLWAWGGSREYGSKLENVFPKPQATETPRRVGTDSDWRRVAMCWHATVAVKKDGTLWGWGVNNEGELGIGSSARVTTPVCLSSNAGWVDVQGGVSFFLALRADGTIWAWGSNSHGQLGNGTKTNMPFISQVNQERDWKTISAGSWNSFALKQNGTLWGWGFDANSSRGTDDLVPTRIDNGTNWAKIAAGDFHLLALRADGTLWLRGQNAGNTAAAYASNSCANLVQVGTNTDWQDIWSGENYFLARKIDGSWWGCGKNAAANVTLLPTLLGPTRSDKPSRLPLDFDPWALACGDNTTGLLTRDGVLWTWGTRLGAPGRLNWSGRLDLLTRRIAALFGRPSGIVPKALPEDNSPRRVWRLPQVSTRPPEARIIPETNAAKGQP